MTEFDKLVSRSEELRTWLGVKAPNITKENLHLVDGSKEQAHWALGYFMALSDMAALFSRKSGGD
jgi:hypothetical protein